MSIKRRVENSNYKGNHMRNKTVAGIEYTLPEVYLLQDTGIGTAEYAARTCYNSFDKSENQAIKGMNKLMSLDNEQDTLMGVMDSDKRHLNNIEDSELLKDLAWTYFHHSILEHAVLTYAIKGTSRAVLQEHARHRIQAISVQSTRYTMSPIINAFVSCFPSHNKEAFQDLLSDIDFLMVTNEAKSLEINQIWDKLYMQLRALGEDEFLKKALSKAALESFNKYKGRDPEIIMASITSNKAKRNVGDSFKWIVTDNWKVDMVVTFNLRSLKNYFELRDSGAAFWQIQELAKAMKEVTPKKYLDLIIKGNKNG